MKGIIQSSFFLVSHEFILEYEGSKILVMLSQKEKGSRSKCMHIARGSLKKNERLTSSDDGFDSFFPISKRQEEAKERIQPFDPEPSALRFRRSAKE